MPSIIGFMPHPERPVGSPHRVVALALPGVVLLDLAAPTHLFGHCGGPLYSFDLAGAEAGPIATSTGFDVVAPHGLAALEQADTIVVPGSERREQPGSEILTALRTAFARGARIMSVCTGAFVLAHAGLLDGRRAATHWASATRLSDQFPSITVDPSVLYVDEGRILTSAGVASGLDLCLHVIRRDHGVDVAARVARRTVIAPHRDGGQAQYIQQPVVPARDDEPGLAETRQWALGHLGEPLDVEMLARKACISPRTFARRFRRETGTTPIQWLLDQRVLAAQALLETTDLSIEVIAGRCGFATTTSLREHFARRLATTPSAYRRAFRTATSETLPVH